MKKTHFSEEYLSWQYFDNPEGKAIAVCAIEDDKVVGHYAAQPIQSVIEGKIVPGLFILNAAVDPANQGKGVLRGIADYLHQQAADQGYRFMIGVGNKNSTPIYTKRFGFRLIAPLDVKIGMGVPKINASHPYFYCKQWNEESLKWRLSNPSYGYKLEKHGENTVVTKKNYPFLSSLLGTFGPVYGLKDIRHDHHVGFHLYLGIDAGINWKENPWFVNFPEFAKPSPLNLIFREVQGDPIPISRENILFRCLDFDAF